VAFSLSGGDTSFTYSQSSGIVMGFRSMLCSIVAAKPVNSMNLHTLVTLAVPLALSLRASTFGVLTRLDEVTARLNHPSEFFFIHIFTT
jgi:hypothetical protein